MFGMLTPAELSGLAHTFSNGAHAAHNVTEALALAASLFPICTPEEEHIWDARRRWVDLADDLSGLAAECRSARAALAVRMAADA